MDGATGAALRGPEAVRGPFRNVIFCHLEKEVCCGLSPWQADGLVLINVVLLAAVHGAD